MVKIEATSQERDPSRSPDVGNRCSRKMLGTSFFGVGFGENALKKNYIPEINPEDLIEIHPEDLIEINPNHLIEINSEDLIENNPEDMIEINPEDLIEINPEDPEIENLYQNIKDVTINHGDLIKINPGF
ncbi:hypothetical protein CEXT_29551 [Caerostris extrusa]|uniref:Uncharacterized protein n=1 Tax=Caerostris extrusa TaxID=172846 RepID=A0AAV4XVX3_CAEEX|nr:hypothetical protein CEXT_29551 [Caerostris extrusa]